ncbi:MAG TPA: MSMEG_0569 family flavin-dependent oxidoreductase [Chthoniobacterales bacterium]|nr:MSMEG_0569 family flavin-dependent oxidoreductase [Chthoniobacterales bacterium]
MDDSSTGDHSLQSHYPAIIIGGGQAGLSMSYCLKERGIDHLVFEKHRLGEAWRSKRWDSFCLVTPNWQCQLPGFDYPGNDPHGFMAKEEIVQYLEAYARYFNPPVKEGVLVSNLRGHESGLFEIKTSEGDYSADQVVIATGGYQIETIPRIAERFPPAVKQVHSADYKNPESLPAGDVLVVGSGQSGCQIAEDLHLAGRQVHLCVGGAPRTARRYRGKDVVTWLHEMGYYSMPVHEHPLKERVRAKANHYVTGRGGGRDIDLRKFALEGMKLYGRLQDVGGNILRFADDLKQNLDRADSVSESIKTTIDKYIEANHLIAPVEPRYQPVWEPTIPILELDYVEAKVGAVIWSVGFRTDYSWIEVPIFDGKGYPCHRRGITSVAGIYFLGLPWQYTWGSGRFSGVAQDAWFLADCIEARHAESYQKAGKVLNELALGA